MTTSASRRPLNDAEFDRLGAFLAAINPPVMTLEMLDGYFAALICGPDMVPPSEYLPRIWGEEFAFDSADQADDIIGLILRHWNAISSEFRKDPHVYMPFLSVAEDGVTRGNDWAQGFMKGVGLRPGSWGELINSDEHGGPIVPILLLAHENDPDPTLRPPPVADDAREDLMMSMIVGAALIYRYFEPHRRSLRHMPAFDRWTKIGRNEPCPCGSGLKYKRCCGDDAPILH